MLLILPAWFEFFVNLSGGILKRESGRGDGRGFTLPVTATSEVANRDNQRSLK